MPDLRKAFGIPFLLVGVLLLADAMRQVVNGAPIFVNDGFDGPYIIRLFGPGTIALIGGLWLSTRKASRVQFADRPVESRSLQHALGVDAHVPTSTTAPVETVSEVWDACSRCSDVNVVNVESLSMCSCGRRESVSGGVDAWPPCPTCQQPRVTKARTGRCGACGALRRRNTA